jgi:hypothetical protein
MSGLVQEPQSSSAQNQRCGLSSSSVLFSFIMSLSPPALHLALLSLVPPCFSHCLCTVLSLSLSSSPSVLNYFITSTIFFVGACSRIASFGKTHPCTSKTKNP